MKKNLLLFCLLSLTWAAQSNDSIPGVEDFLPNNIENTDIPLPENFDMNMDSLLQDWHIKNFIPIEQSLNFDSLNPEVSDSVIMKRLAAMQTIVPMTYNKVVRSFIDKYAGDRRKQVAAMLGISDYFFPLFEQTLEKYNVPNELKYLPIVESALNPNAKSKVGATGLWQFMFFTGKIYGLEVNSLIDDRRDPIKSTDAAVRYLKDLYGIFGDWHLAIAAYNCGPGNVNKAITRSGGKRSYWEIYPYLPKETRGYVPLLIAASYVMTYYKEHRIAPIRTDYPLHTDTLMLNTKIHFDHISTIIGISKNELIMLNPQYRAEIIPATEENPMSICLPANYTLAFLDNQDSIVNFNSAVFVDKLNIEPTQAPKAAQPAYKIYKVRSGDTLSEIASKHHTTVTNLKKKNNLRSSLINPGMRLKIY